jgi:hypothetical protein
LGMSPRGAIVCEVALPEKDPETFGMGCLLY